jgi:hypothetical protein
MKTLLSGAEFPVQNLLQEKSYTDMRSNTLNANSMARLGMSSRTPLEAFQSTGRRLPNGRMTKMEITGIKMTRRSEMAVAAETTTGVERQLKSHFR